MFVEISEKFGQHIANSAGGPEARITRAFRLLLTRPPTATALAVLKAFHTKHNNWAALTRALLSLDETVTKS